jgi:hypothetical protein
MSEVKTNKLTGTSTAGSILVTGEGNSTTTNLATGVGEGLVLLLMEMQEHLFSLIVSTVPQSQTRQQANQSLTSPTT